MHDDWQVLDVQKQMLEMHFYRFLRKILKTCSNCPKCRKVRMLEIKILKDIFWRKTITKDVESLCIKSNPIKIRWLTSTSFVHFYFHCFPQFNDKWYYESNKSTKLWKAVLRIRSRTARWIHLATYVIHDIH